MIYARLFLRAFIIVFLTACNVKLIGRSLYGPAFVTGFGISAAWWFNSRTAAHSETRGAWAAYALGAGCGTTAGMVVGGML